MKEVSELVVGKVESETKLFICFTDFVFEFFWHEAGNFGRVKFNSDLFLRNFFFLTLFSFLFIFFFFLYLLFHFFFCNLGLKVFLCFLDCPKGVFEVEFVQNLSLFLGSVELESKRSFLDFFIDQEIGTLAFSPPMFPSKAVDFNVMGIEFSDSFVIKFYPFVFWFFDIAEIMAELCTSIM